MRAKETADQPGERLAAENEKQDGTVRVPGGANHKLTPTAAAGKQYVAHGWSVVSFPRGAKGPKPGQGDAAGWNRPENAARMTEIAARSPDRNIGLLHAQSRTCALDVDDLSRARAALSAAGIDLDALMEAPDSVMIDSGRPNRIKLIYHLPPGCSPLPTKQLKQDGYELRCATADGNSVQDVLPPSIHPETGQPYKWRYGNDLVGDWRHLPELPPEILAHWRRLLGDSAAADGPISEHIGEDAADFSALDAYQPPLNLTDEQVEEVLSRVNIDPDAGYQSWIRVGMGVHHQYGGDQKGLEIFDRWSQTQPHYKGLKETTHKYKSFGKRSTERGPMITFATVIEMAGGLPASMKRASTEYGLADRFIDRFGAGLMFVPEFRAWLKWDGCCWHTASIEEIHHLVKIVIRELPLEAAKCEDDDLRTAQLKFAARCQSAKTTSNVIDIARSDPAVCTPVRELDKEPYLLGCANGVIDLRTGELLPPDPERRITKCTDVEYHDSAACPLFEQTVLEAFGCDREMAEFFQRAVGYSIQGAPSEDKLIIPYGSGSNGKGTVLGAITAALGDYATTAAPGSFVSAKESAAEGGARPDLVALRGRRLVWVGEPDEGAVLREGIVKSMTGGDIIPARELYSSVIMQIKPTWVAWMPTNHKPIIKGSDHAIWRRILLLPFMQQFGGQGGRPKDGRREVLRRPENLPGILRWCVDGARMYRRDGLRPPAAIEAATAQYRTDMDLLAEWLEESCDTGADLEESISALWASWEGFARARGELKYIASQKALSQRLEGRFTRVEKMKAGPDGRRARGFRGLRLISGGEL